MRLRDVKIGERYSWRDWSGEAGEPGAGIQVVADSILKAGQGHASRITATSTESGKQYECPCPELTPWDEYLKEEARRAAQERPMLDKLGMIARALGPGASGVINEWGSPTLLLSERAAQRILSICGSKLIPQDRKPSETSDPYEWEYRCELLSRRVKKALGHGTSGHGYIDPDRTHQASLIFHQEEELDRAIESLGLGSQVPSSLSQLVY